MVESSDLFIDKSNEPLGLIHIDICDLKFMQTRSDKKNLFTFINDCIWYHYINLLISKYEALKVFKHLKNEVENQLS
jgi:hypothetical protein